MRNLLQLLIKNQDFIIFLVLQLICLSLIINNQSYHRSRVFNTLQETNGRLLAAYSSVEEYFNLADINQQLARENASLKQLLEKNQYGRTLGSDSIVTDSATFQQYRFIPAKVINSSFNKRQNYITLNRGRLHGIRPGQGVIGPNGIIGVVNGVSKHYSSVIPLIHPKGRATGKFLHSDHFGPVLWSGGDYRMAEMNDIPKQAPIHIGDTIITDERSSVYPPGVMIGRITAFELNPETGFYKLELQLSTDYSALSFVYVVENKLLPERGQLEAEAHEE
ncbi:MAG: rod shape-determining protein MreC [Bacteroidota bacterium]|nr:rod shape-determining protein MreC [Bacteroidota bacterium]MDX5428836.1 rod shape-determining protein MreC [Bacteroidota bacterium]MDX5448720.1 rod shape-determining protein MreC [Bacteroidota bacterium]MDX5506523.1 rod shape-determining protein MreC [Bacteroidota bacterium]